MLDLEELYKTIDQLQLEENYEELLQIIKYAADAIGNDIDD